MQTEEEVQNLRVIVQRGTRTARELSSRLCDMASHARVYGEDKRPINLSPETADELAEAILSTSATTRLLLERLEASSIREAQLESCFATGMVLVTQLKRMKLRELVAWWLRHRQGPGHPARAARA